MILALLLAWPITAALLLTLVVLCLLWTEHEFVSSLVVVAATALGIYAIYEAGHVGTSVTVGQIATYIGAYIGIGFVFTVPKWWLWAQKMGRKFQATKAAWVASDPQRKDQFTDRFVREKLNRDEQRIMDNTQNGFASFGSTEDRDALNAKLSILKVEANAAWEVKRQEDFVEEWNARYSKSVMKVRQIEDGSYDVFYDKPVLVGYLTSWVLNWPFYGLLLLIEDFVAEVINWFADRIGKTFRNIARRAFNPAV
jgi:hypothetical protein